MTSALAAVVSIASMSLCLSACSDTTMSGSAGKQPTSPASAADDTASTPATAASPSADAASNAGAPNTADAGSAGVTTATATTTKVKTEAVPGTLTITKILGTAAVEDTALTFTVAYASGSGPSATVTFAPGADAAQKLAGFCAPGAATHLAVSTQNSSNVQNNVLSDQTVSSGSSLTYHPDVDHCPIAQLFSDAESGDQFQFTCPGNQPVTVTSAGG